MYTRYGFSQTYLVENDVVDMDELVTLFEDVADVDVDELVVDEESDMENRPLNV